LAVLKIGAMSVGWSGWRCCWETVSAVGWRHWRRSVCHHKVRRCVYWVQSLWATCCRL